MEIFKIVYIVKFQNKQIVRIIMKQIYFSLKMIIIKFKIVLTKNFNILLIMMMNNLKFNLDIVKVEIQNQIDYKISIY